MATKIFLYTGGLDNSYLNNAIHAAEEFFRSARPAFTEESANGDRAEHCWRGDPSLPSKVSCLRYHTMSVDRILKRVDDTALTGADPTSWPY